MLRRLTLMLAFVCVGGAFAGCGAWESCEEQRDTVRNYCAAVAFGSRNSCLTAADDAGDQTYCETRLVTDLYFCQYAYPAVCD